MYFLFIHEITICDALCWRNMFREALVLRNRNRCMISYYSFKEILLGIFHRLLLWNEWAAFQKREQYFHLLCISRNLLSHAADWNINSFESKEFFSIFETWFIQYVRLFFNAIAGKNTLYNFYKISFIKSFNEIFKHVFGLRGKVIITKDIVFLAKQKVQNNIHPDGWEYILHLSSTP